MTLVTGMLSLLWLGSGLCVDFIFSFGCVMEGLEICFSSAKSALDWKLPQQLAQESRAVGRREGMKCCAAEPLFLST